MVSIECLTDGLGQHHAVTTTHASTVSVRHGMLFFDQKKHCNLRKELAGPPGRRKRNGKGELELRIAEGRWYRITFEDVTKAESLFKECWSAWEKASKSEGIAAKVAAALSQTCRERSRSSSRRRAAAGEPRVPDMKQNRVREQLGEIELEKLCRQTQVKKLGREVKGLEDTIIEDLAFEHRVRSNLTRQEFCARLRKERDTRMKINGLAKEAEEERSLLSNLEFREKILVGTLGEAEAHAEPKRSADTKSSTGVKDADATQCIACCDARRSVLFLPCLHLTLCNSCAGTEITSCPICRASVDHRIRGIFL